MKVATSIILALLLSGCSGRAPVLPEIKSIDPVSLSWEDMECKSRKIHALNSYEWQLVQEELINRRHKHNMCAELINSVREK